ILGARMAGMGLSECAGRMRGRRRLAEGRMVVTYSDGSWTDNLSVARYETQVSPHGLTLTIEVEPRERPGKVRLARQALRDFLSKHMAVHTIQIGTPRFTARLRTQVRVMENPRLDLRLRADGV